MGFFDDIFSGFFDFNGDGKTTWDEQWIAHKIIQDIKAETKKENSYNPPFYDDDEFESYMDELEKEFDEAIAASDDDDWRLYVDENSYGINPYDYETQEEYIEAIEEAGLETEEKPVEIPITLNFTVEFPALDKIDAIKESDYPNKRLYNAAVRKVSLETGLIIGLNKAEKTKEIEQCNFILNNFNNCIAAKYLTTEYGEFLYTQAVKENFNLPFDLPDEDEQMITPVDDLFRQIHNKCKNQLFPIWKWLIENFVPYMQYSSDNGYKLSTGIILNSCFIDDDFIYGFADYVSENKVFGKLIIELSPSLSREYGTLFALLLKKQQTDFAKQLFSICAEKNIDSAHINGVIFGLMESCSNYEELETMELFEQHIFPLVKDINKADVKDMVPAWEDKIRNYYTYCEENCEQYQFTRKNAWRNKYKEQADEIGLNVVNYATEEEFLTNYNEKKYRQRDYYTSDKISANILNKPKSYSYDETLELREDKTVYTYVGVLFPYATHHYHYLTDDDSITIGDSVIVPVGADNKEMVAKVVSVEKHMRISAPFPVEKTKKIIRKKRCC